MSFRRYEILLPSRYNDGTTVPPEKIDAVVQELADRFGGLSFHPETLRGIWLHQGERFEEGNVRLVVDVEDTKANARFFADYKETLKTSFHQIDIWIVSYRIS